jgi:hypothetical protein
LNGKEIRDLAALYRNGLTYAPPRGAVEIREFNRSTLMVEYRLLLGRFLRASYRLSMKDEEGHEVPTTAATPADRQAWEEAKQDCEECRDALRADWSRRKAEQLVGYSLGLHEIRAVVHDNAHELFPGEFS